MLLFKKIITWSLILLLVSQEIFRIPYSLSTAQAVEIANHENIVSLVVEENLYKKMKSDIEKYALRVQAVLPHTRTVILTFPESAHPMLIASANERLYYSGLPNHGKKTQKLVGTILIGDIPLPTVHKNTSSFLSVYPYIDFDEPNFVWNWEKNTYEYLNIGRKDARPELWHSVIAPHTGDLTQDAKKIQDFFARVYQYDAKQGQYVNVGKDPQVLYVDSVRDSEATSPGSFAAYESLFVPNQESFSYNRYTKEFAQYLYTNYTTLMKERGAALVPKFSEWKIPESRTQSFTTPDLSAWTEGKSSFPSFLSNAADISTRIFSQELIPSFIKTLNEKYIGDISRWVHQSGRYYDGYSKVRVDTMPELIQQRDKLSTKILQQVNTTFETVINNYIERAMSVDIPVLVSRSKNSSGFGFTYTNYFFGQKALNFTEATQCSLLRGSSFGGYNTTTEMNHGYHIQGAQDDAKLVVQDANAGIKCTNQTNSYWGGNSALNLSFTSGGSPTLKTHWYDDFSQPVYDPAGGKRANSASSPFDCLKTDLILEPYSYRIPILRVVKTFEWPKETSGKRYSCATDFQSRTQYFNLEPTPESQENIFQTLSNCSGVGNVKLLGRDGKVSTTCASSGGGGTYKLVSSLVKHTSPDTETYGRQLTSLATPNLPVDEERYVLYVDRNIQEKRFSYPNVFDISVPIDATDELIRTKILTYLSSFDTLLIPGKDTASLGVFAHLVMPGATPVRPSLSQIVTSNPDLLNNIIASLRWKNLPTVMKYQNGINEILSGNKSEKVALFGKANKSYEISYLGGQGDAKNFVIGYHPDVNGEYPNWYQSILDAQNTYQDNREMTTDIAEDFVLSQQDYAAVLGTAPRDTAKSDVSDGCTDENAVVIWKWLPAIQCWLKHLFDTKWEAGDTKFSFDWEPYLSISWGNKSLFSTTNATDISHADTNHNTINDVLENRNGPFTLRNTTSNYVLEPGMAIRLDAYLEQGGNVVNEDTSPIEAVVTKIVNLDTGKTYTSKDAHWETVKKQYISLTGSAVLTDGRASWTVRSLTNARISFELETHIQSGGIVYIQSDKITLVPESHFPAFTVLSSEGSLTPKTVNADDVRGINVLFTSEDAPTTVDIEITNYLTNASILKLGSVPVQNKTLRLGSPAADIVLHKAGKYIMKMTTNGLSETTDLFIAPGAPKNVTTDIPPVLLVGENRTIHLSVTDTWGNSINPNSWNITIHASQPVIFSGNSQPAQDITFPLSKKIQFRTVRENSITFDIVAKYNQETINKSLSFIALSDVVIEPMITQSGVVKVGQELPVNFLVKTKNGTVIENWNRPLKIKTKGTRASLVNDVVSFTGGKGQAVLRTGTQSGKTYFYLSDVLAGKKIGNDIEIAPDVPSRITFSGPETLLARKGQSQTLSVNIYDTYGNYIHPSTVDVRIEADRTDLLEPLGPLSRIEGDTYGVHLISTGYPGRILLRGSLWKNGIKNTKIGLENVWKVQILPVISSEDIANNTWNSLTHVLLGGPFGQFVTSGYFGGSLLFSPRTSALSVSTLIDNPRSGLASIASSGTIRLIGKPHLGTGLRVAWQPDPRGAFALAISDKRLGDLARVTYPRFSDSVRFSPCQKGILCDSMVFAPSGSDTVFKDNTLFYNGVALSTLKDIFDAPSLSFAFISSLSGIQLSVLYQEKSIGTLTLSFAPRIPSLSLSQDKFSIELLMSDIVSDNTWGSISSSDVRGVMLLESSSSSQYVGGPTGDGYSSYPKKYGMGWTGENVGLLQFAAGNNWAETQKDFGDYVTVNLGDPLITLPDYKVESTTGFDATIGVPVYMGSEDITHFSLTDLNNDGQRDIMVTDSTNTVSASLSKKDGTYLDMGEFLSFENARKDSIRTGDFFGDGYADAVYVDNGGTLRLASHNALGTEEIDISSDKARDLGSIVQMEVFDMDHDGRDDIIIMDILGQLSIFHGAPNQRFIYQFVDHVFDFAFSDTSLFTGSVYYGYPGFSFPDYTKTQEPVFRSQQEQLQSLLFTSVSFSRPGNVPTNTPATPLGTQFANSFQSTDSTTDGATLAAGYNALQTQYGGALSISDTTTNNETLSLLKAPFIDKKILDISKRYSSLEKDGMIIPGSLIQGVISVKNTSSSLLSKLIISEIFPTYLEGPISLYTLKQAGVSTERSFASSSDGGVADLRDITLAPGETIELIYTAKFASFSFGSFDVGFLEDKNDPLMNIDVPKDKILTINPAVQNLASIPEKDFYNTDHFGDIRINPNDTCGGPLFLWRSHNSFDRTYQKTLIVRNIVNPDDTAMDMSNNPLSSDLATAAPTLAQSTSPAYVASAQTQLDTYNRDSDGDRIPDRYDEDNGDVFTVNTSGDSTQITVGLGKLDGMIDQAISGVETVLSGLSCGFGDPGCIASPMNWTVNVPGNTITALGYAVPLINQAPIACNKDVRCGIPLFSFPTASTPYFWPPNPDKAGGMFDMGSNSKIGAGDKAFTGGYGTSQFRFFLGGTLTGAIAAVLCFGPNNAPTLNFPGLFPLVFEGNCIYATQPLTQCSDDGSGDSAAVEGLEVTQDFGGVQFSDADSCDFFTPTIAYPQSLIDAVNRYINNPTSANLDAVRIELSKNTNIATGGYESDQSLLFSTSSPYQNIQSTTNNSVISFPEIGNGNGMIKVKIDSSSIEPTNITQVLDIQLKSISAFPRFIMDWYHRQMDEIVSSLSSLPDIKIFLPDLSAGFADGGWIPEFGSSDTSISNTNTALSGTGSTGNSGDVFTPLDAATDARNSLVGGAQQALGSIQSVFEYLSLLPFIHIRPETISLDLPWIDRSVAQSWLARNESILAQWEALPANAIGNAVDTGPLIASIRSNIETVRSYMTLPEQLQKLFYLKEKLLYEIMKNVYAVQQLMGGWLANNGERFKAWVEAFILITKLWDLWQILIDVFDDYEQECAVCHNEQWNLQEWGWIVISAVVPPIPVVKMPRWPDIELDFSDINLSMDIAYPVFDFSFYPIELPDMPTPSFAGFALDPIPQLPPLPDLNIDFSVPTINLPKLPNLPPAPKIPALSASISIVLKIFKIITLIQCLYRKVPLSPEWYVGTKIAHQTDRQGYLPIDFLNVQMPSVAMKWIDAIRVSTHVELKYDADFIVEAIRSALEPLTNFPRNLTDYTGDTPSSVDFNLSQENGLRVQTSSLDQLPELIGQLYEQTANPQDANIPTEQNTLTRLLAEIDPSKQPTQIATISANTYSDRFQERAKLVTEAIQKDIDSNAVFLADLTGLSQGKKQMRDIAWLQTLNPHNSQLAAAPSGLGSSALLDLMPSLSQKMPSVIVPLVAEVSQTLAVVAPPIAPRIIPPETTPPETSTTASLKKSKGLYITKNGATKRLNYFYEGTQENTIIHLMDDDRDGDEELFYTIGNTIYRKENYTVQPKAVYITDTPRVFTVVEMMHDFFGLDSTDINTIPHDMQIFLRQNHTFENIEAEYMMHKKTDHEQFDIFSLWGQSDPQLAKYRVDSILQPLATTNGYAVISQPSLADISGQATLKRAKIYRTLLPKQKYTEGDTTLRDLSTDFVIRAKKIVYTKETTQIQLIFGNEKKDIELHSGEVLLFGRDSKIVIKSGSLILPSDEIEEIHLDRSHIGTPLFPDDSIKTSQNGTAQIAFSDSTNTILYPNQEWSLIYNTGAFKVQEFGLPVSPGWYYVVAHDATSLREHSLPEATLFDTYTDTEGDILTDTLPTTINLKFDIPTEIDFQQYFPIDSIMKVEVSGLPDKFWRQNGATKIIFETLQQSQSIILKVTGKKGTVYTYNINLNTEPAKLMISGINTDKVLSGTLSENTALPLAIQSYLDKKTWTISSGIIAQDKKFSTSFTNSSPVWDVSYGTNKVFSLSRNTGVLNFDNTLTLVPEIRVGYPLTLKTMYNQKEIARVLYQGSSLSFQQVASTTDITKNTLSLLSSSLRLETSSTGDTALPKGAYIVDSQYRPLIAFDANGIVRYLDTNIKFSVGYEGNKIVFAFLREGLAVGKLYLFGDMLTVWDS